MSAPVLELAGIGKSFPGVKALDDVSLTLGANEVVGLIGENGAGKSTLMRILAGVHRPDAGTMRLHGEAVTLASPQDAARRGIGMVFQEQSLLPNLTVGQNIYLGSEARFSTFGIVRWSELYAAAARQLAKVQVDVDPRTATSELDFATRQMVELAKALTLEELTAGRLVILLDEPTSVLEQADIDILFARVRALKDRASFVFVSHRLDEVLALSDRVYVMKDGAVVAELPAAGADTRKLHQLMVGRERQSEYYKESQQAPFADEVLLEARGLGLQGQYRDVDFALHAGEVLGIAGVIGSGREAVCRTLFGFLQPTAGDILLKNAARRIANPADAVALGIGYVPRERRNEGLVLFLSVAANMTLASLGRVMRHGLIDHAAERRLATEWVRRLRIRTPSITSLCLNLSGGNQQKVVLAKWMNAHARIIILDHPSRGLDVGAKEEVYELVRSMSAEGLGVILIADTLEETIGLCHTILVMRDGAITRRFEAGPGTKPAQVDLIEHMV